MFDKSQLPNVSTEGPLSLPPPNSRAEDFTHLMRRFRAKTFSAEGGDRRVLLFDAQQSVDNGVARRGLSRYTLCQPFFLARDSRAIQLFMPPGAYDQASLNYFQVTGDGPVPGSRITIARDFDIVTVETKLASGYEYTRRYQSDTIDTSTLSYAAYPATPKVFLHYPTIGYVCFTFDRLGCHPFLIRSALPVTNIRCFYGQAEKWQEIDVLSAELGARGTGNLRFKTSLGEFFVPGPNSMGPSTYTPPRGTSVECTEFELESFQNPLSPAFDLNAHHALRSLGLPPIWPDPEFL